ncbi:MAG TPA: hypothetical protein VFF80_03580, partial [Bacillota bacterium]|nr:hypothetical protein [Bacillota bacterium]
GHCALCGKFEENCKVDKQITRNIGLFFIFICSGGTFLTFNPHEITILAVGNFFDASSAVSQCLAPTIM